MKRFFVYCLVLVAGVSIANAQKIVLKSGSFKEIKSEKFFNIQYDYSDMGVGKFDEEEDYIKKKVADYNEKEAGRGAEWREAWISDRDSRFHPKFEELLNKYLDEKGVFVGEENKDAKYTMVLKTTFTEPGYNVYVSKKPAKINVILSIVESANPENVVVSIISKNNPGRSMGMNDFDTGERIEEAYAKCGKELGKWIVKKGL